VDILVAIDSKPLRPETVTPLYKRSLLQGDGNFMIRAQEPGAGSRATDPPIRIPTPLPLARTLHSKVGKGLPSQVMGSADLFFFPVF